jgi:hypothetical protein
MVGRASKLETESLEHAPLPRPVPGLKYRHPEIPALAHETDIKIYIYIIHENQ